MDTPGPGVLADLRLETWTRRGDVELKHGEGMEGVEPPTSFHHGRGRALHMWVGALETGYQMLQVPCGSPD